MIENLYNCPVCGGDLALMEDHQNCYEPDYFMVFLSCVNCPYQTKEKRLTVADFENENMAEIEND